jgi:hypothetical protein
MPDEDQSESPSVGNWLFLVGCTAWVMADHAAAFLGLAPCPICQGRPLAPKVYCTGCDRTGLDGKYHFPGLNVDECPNEDWCDEEWSQLRPHLAPRPRTARSTTAA